MSEANDITAKLLERIPQEFPTTVRVWRNNRIKAIAIRRGGKKRLVNAGVNGQADISGIVAPSGRRLEIEVKAGKDRLSLDQINFGNMIRQLGGIYLVVRDLDSGLASLRAALTDVSSTS
jgi:hypothetical protein